MSVVDDFGEGKTHQNALSLEFMFVMASKNLARSEHVQTNKLELTVHRNLLADELQVKVNVSRLTNCI